MEILVHLEGFKYRCMCGNMVDIGRHFTEEEQEWTVCGECNIELIDMCKDDKFLNLIHEQIKINPPKGKLVLPKLGT